MGFFDVRCQLTGISAFCNDVEGLLVLQGDERFAPVSVLVRGKYNRLGGVDMIKPSGVMDASFEALSQLITEGRMRIDVPYDDLESFVGYRKKHCRRAEDLLTVHGFEWLFAVLSYATWNETTALYLDDKPITSCLFVSSMVDAAVATMQDRDGAEPLDVARFDNLLDRAFAPESAGRSIHATALRPFASKDAGKRALLRLALLRAFLLERGGPRAMEAEQDTYDTEHLPAVEAFGRLSTLPRFRHALAERYPDALREKAIAQDRLEAAQKQGGAKPYDPAAKYKQGEVVAHPKFGEGIVAEESKGGRVAIDFADQRRKLVCGA